MPISIPTILAAAAALGIVVFLAFRVALFYRQPNDASNPMLLVFLGSGGHTGEMIGMLRNMELDRFVARVYVSSDGDTLSERRARDLDELSGPKAGSQANSSKYLKLSRARSVGQSWITTVFSSAICLNQCFAILLSTKPTLILTNGPGSSVMLCYAALFLRVLGLGSAHIVYVESLARVNSLSVSGRLLYPVVDRFVVQWPGLLTKYPNASCTGALI